MSIKLSVLKNLGAGAWGKLSGILVRLLQVPLLISVLGVNEFGLWLVLYSLPSWLALANLGFGSAAANEMSIAIASNDNIRAKTIFSTTFSMIVIIGLVGSALCAIVIPFVPVDSFFQVLSNREREIHLAMFYLAVSTFLSFVIDINYGRFRAARKAHTAVILGSFRQWFDMVAIIISITITKRLDYLALSLLLSNLIFNLLYNYFSFKSLPDIIYSTKLVDKSKFKDLFKMGVAFQAFPLGNALLFQGNILIVQALIGSSAVAIFGTVRTLIRTINQLMETINLAIWPEFTYLFGINDFVNIRKLHRTSVGFSVILSLIGILFLMLFGSFFYNLWVGKSIKLEQHLFVLFLLPIIFNSLWFTSSVVPLSTNNHSGIAFRYMIATIISAISSIFLTYFLKLEGAALSTLVADLILIPYVLKLSLKLTKDTLADFLEGIFREYKSMFARFNRFYNYNKIKNLPVD